jgi:hypothetical protein
MTASSTDIRDLTVGELDLIVGAGLASPTGSFIVFGYGIEWNDRSICIVTPTQDTIFKRPK